MLLYFWRLIAILGYLMKLILDDKVKLGIDAIAKTNTALKPLTDKLY